MAQLGLGPRLALLLIFCLINHCSLFLQIPNRFIFVVSPTKCCGQTHLIWGNRFHEKGNNEIALAKLTGKWNGKQLGLDFAYGIYYCNGCVVLLFLISYVSKLCPSGHSPLSAVSMDAIESMVFTEIFGLCIYLPLLQLKEIGWLEMQKQ